MMRMQMGSDERDVDMSEAPPSSSSDRSRPLTYTSRSSAPGAYEGLRSGSKSRDSHRRRSRNNPSEHEVYERREVRRRDKSKNRYGGDERRSRSPGWKSRGQSRESRDRRYYDG